MKKYLQTFCLFTIFLSQLSLCQAATLLESQILLDPNGVPIKDITPAITVDPLALPDPAAFNPAILQGATTGTTNTGTTPTQPAGTTTPTTPPAGTNTGVTTPTTTPTPTVTTTPPTKTPPRDIPTPRPIPTQPTAQPTAEPTNTVIVSGPEYCPPIAPFADQRTECPKVKTVPIIPQFPVGALAAPILAVGLFWLIITYLNRGQLRVEQQFTRRSLANAHKHHVDQTRSREYQSALDHLTSGLSSPDGLSTDKFAPHLAKIQLLGSAKMQKLAAQIDLALHENNRTALKPLIRDLAQQIKKEI